MTIQCINAFSKNPIYWIFRNSSDKMDHSLSLVTLAPETNHGVRDGQYYLPHSSKIVWRHNTAIGQIHIHRSPHITLQVDLFSQLNAYLQNMICIMVRQDSKNNTSKWLYSVQK